MKKKIFLLKLLVVLIQHINLQYLTTFISKTIVINLHSWKKRILAVKHLICKSAGFEKVNDTKMKGEERIIDIARHFIELLSPLGHSFATEEVICTCLQ